VTSKRCLILSQIFTFKIVLKNFLFIVTSASLVGLYETVIYAFLAFNTFDKTEDNPLSVPFLVQIAYFGSSFFASLGKCQRCYRHSDYRKRK